MSAIQPDPADADLLPKVCDSEWAATQTNEGRRLLEVFRARIAQAMQARRA